MYTVFNMRITAKEIKIQETNLLRQWAIRHNRMIPADTFNRHWVEQGYIKGAEHHVYFDELRNRVIKRNHLTYQNTWLQYFQRMAAHNFLFPGAPYTFEGLMEVQDNHQKTWLFSVVFQSVIIAERGLTIAETGAFMESLGYVVRANEQFHRAGVTGPKWDDYVDTATGLMVNDLHFQNILRDSEGGIHVIDPWIELSPPMKTEKPQESDGGKNRRNPLGWLDNSFTLSTVLSDGSRATPGRQEVCRRDLLQKLTLALPIEPAWLIQEPLVHGSNAVWMRNSITSTLRMPRMTTEEFVEQANRIRRQPNQ